MRFKDKQKICQRTAVWVAILAFADVLGIEFGVLPKELGDEALTMLIVLLAASLAGNFYFKNKGE